MNHPTTLVKVNDYEAEIDNDLVPLITALWKADLFTFNCCQENHPGIVWIEFAHTMDAEIFLNIVADKWSADLDSLYCRVRGEFDHDDSWDYTAHIDDMSASFELDEDEDMVTETSDGDPIFNFTMSVRFPRSDLPVVVKKMEKFVKKMEKAKSKLN